MVKPAFRWLALLAAALVIIVAPVPRRQAVPADRTISVEASQFSFTPSTLTVNPGDRVTLELRSTDVVHGLYLDHYDISVAFDPGQVATLSFVADRPGSFRFRCSVPCGDIHPFMIGRLRVGPNWLLIRAVGLTLIVAAWAIAVGAPSQIPAKETAA
jgi:heme/copper-type cytochrome/quinol oxidase subunit 2